MTDVKTEQQSTFEQWAAANDYDIAATAPERHGYYRSAITRAAWEGWQAALRDHQCSLPASMIDAFNSGDGSYHP